MLEIKRALKYFNKGKKNQVRAIDDTSVTLEDTGLVALLGPSGCGKTTLLNAIGGLDKLNKGSIYVNSEKISSSSMYKVDKIRNLRIGYIFQDYKLIDNMSVYDNVALVLKMIGIKDKKEIKKRVEYVLDKVGMLRYKKRPCNMLSGGERQRVGIARAIVKDPLIILADEPTGNLDSKNSLEIMNILRTISKDKLVVLVTHEENLARFYASRIIELQDGKIIKDYKNNHNDELDYQLENTFYLKDFEKQNKIKDSNYDINIYASDKDKIKLDLIVSNGNIYIRSNDVKKIEVVDESSSIEFVDDHYKKTTKNDINKYNFDFQNIINKDIKLKYSSIFNPVTLIVNGFKKIFEYSFIKKLLLIGFFLSGMFMMFAFNSIGAALRVKDTDFITKNKDYLTVVQNKVKVDDFLKYEKYEGVKYILPGTSLVNLELYYKDYYQSSNIDDSLNGSLVSIETINDSDLKYGIMPTNNLEVVVDELALTKMMNETRYAEMLGIKDVKDMIGRTISVSNMSDFKIVGIVSKESPSIYVSNDMFVNIIANTGKNKDKSNIIDYDIYKDKIEIKKGRIPSNDYEAIVNISNQDSMPLDKEIDSKVNGKKLKVVGYYSSKEDYNFILVNNNTIKYNLISSMANMTVYSDNKEKTLEEFRKDNLNIEDTYSKDRKNYLDSTSEYRNGSLLAALVVCVISLVEIFLMMRSSFLSRVKEIGILRAIGVKRIDIYKMFLGENLAITTVAGLPGILIMAYILKVASTIYYIGNYICIDGLVVLVTIVVMYLFNIIVGLLPVFNTVRKRPARILARHDLD